MAGDIKNNKMLRSQTGSNYTVRCSLLELDTLIKKHLNGNQKEELIRIGWGFILEYKLKSNISRPLIIWLYKKLDPETLTMEFAGGVELKVTAHVVHVLFGLPNGDIQAPRPSKDGDTSALRWLKEKLGLTDTDVATVKHLIIHIKKGGTDDFTMRCIYLVFCMKLICPTQHSRISREAGVVQFLDYEKSANMDICQLVVDEIKRAAIKFHSDGSNKNVAEACAVLPLVMYLDSLKCSHSLLTKDTPRANFLDERRLKLVMEADVIKKTSGESLM